MSAEHGNAAVTAVDISENTDAASSKQKSVAETPDSRRHSHFCNHMQQATRVADFFIRDPRSVAKATSVCTVISARSAANNKRKLVYTHSDAYSQFKHTLRLSVLFADFKDKVYPLFESDILFLECSFFCIVFSCLAVL